MQRYYLSWLKHHFKHYRQMVLLAGPRQVGKTTIALQWGGVRKKFYYLNWDKAETQQKIIQGPDRIAEETDLLKLKKEKPLIIFDELHKYEKWKRFLKGFFDTYGDKCQIIVTGSAKLDIYKKIGDSLMGRYFLYHIHPLSVGELLRPTKIEGLIQPPKKISQKHFNQLLTFGGFPEPFLHANARFSANWQRTRKEQLIREDIRSQSSIQEIAGLEMLATLLNDYAGKQMSYSTLATTLRVSVPTVIRWLEKLESFYYCFPLTPWTKDVKRSLRKEPKYYLWDWSQIKEDGAKIENFVASHLLKSVHLWTDLGLGNFSLHYLRDKEKREVDFIVVKEGKPWFLVEVKGGGNNDGISKALYHFQKQTSAEHAFQVNFGMDFVDANCFDHNEPIVVPATTFLSQIF